MASSNTANSQSKPNAITLVNASHKFAHHVVLYNGTLHDFFSLYQKTINNPQIRVQSTRITTHHFQLQVTGSYLEISTRINTAEAPFTNID